MDLKLLDSNIKNLVRTSLTGLTSINQEVAIFDFGNVIVQKKYFENSNVRIISGGAYCFGDMVGKGMLTAAAQGDNFVAPASKVILRMLRELSFNHVKGILIIVRANFGNLLNFGLATERARNDNLRVKLLSISDDIYNAKLPKTSQRGLSGIVLMCKIAGAMSEQNLPLTDIFMFCKKYLSNIVSTEIETGDSVENNPTKCSCRISAGAPLGTKKIRLSLNITQEICTKALNSLLNISLEEEDDELGSVRHSRLNLKPGDSMVLLLNNNGALSKTEEYIYAKEIMDVLNSSAIHVHRFYIGNFIKCGGKTDLTLTAMKVEDQEVLCYLDHPCSAPGWKKGMYAPISLESSILTGKLRRKDRLSPPIRGPILREALANIILFTTQFACEALISCERQLNIIDSERGDGDTGTRLRNVSEILLKRLKQDKLVINCPFAFFETLSKLLESTIGGILGCIYSIMFEAAAKIFGDFSETTEITPFIWLKSFEAAGDALKRYGNIEYGDGTMYDPICAFIKSSRLELEQGKNFIDSFGKGVKAAEETVQLTKRKKYKYPDPGAHGVGVWMRAVYEGVKFRCPLD